MVVHRNRLRKYVGENIPRVAPVEERSEERTEANRGDVSQSGAQPLRRSTRVRTVPVHFN